MRALCPLQDSAHELRCVAQAFAQQKTKLMLGATASESALKQLSRNGDLKQYRIIHFATHGLLAHEVSTLNGVNAEPALVLSPPQDGAPSGGAGTDDGLLTGSEISKLELDADWVIMVRVQYRCWSGRWQRAVVGACTVVLLRRCPHAARLALAG